MAAPTKKPGHAEDGAGISGEHPMLEEEAHRVAPSTAAKKTHNVLRIPAVPWACWKVEDICFAFDSALVLPDSGPRFKALKALFDAEKERYKPPLLGLFGHADPVGDEPYNKALSENRARAVHAVLLRDVGQWKEIFTKQAEVEELQELLATFGHSFAGESGRFGAETERAAKQYMDELCPEFTLAPENFLCAGEKACQGCSEFNPLRVFSKEQAEELGKQENREERNDENQPNRRVIAFLWHGDTKFDPSHWPCPQAPETKGCEKRFWSDGRGRNSPQMTARQWDPDPRSKGGTVSDPASRWGYEKKRDTFACRFYERMATFSPCELAKVALRRERWQVSLKVTEVFDRLIVVTKTGPGQRKLYPPRHKNRIGLHLDCGVRAEYEFVLEFILVQNQKSQWECPWGTIDKARVTGTPIVHPAFKEYVARGYDLEDQFDYDPFKYVMELGSMPTVPAMIGERVEAGVVRDEWAIRRQYKLVEPPRSPALVRLGWSPRMARIHPGNRGIALDFIDSHYELRPGRDVASFNKSRHVRIDWGRKIHGCTGVMRSKKTGAVARLERPSELGKFISSDEDVGWPHFLPLVDGARLVFSQPSDHPNHGPRYRDEVLYLLVCDYAMTQLPWVQKPT